MEWGINYIINVCVMYVCLMLNNCVMIWWKPRFILNTQGDYSFLIPSWLSQYGWQCGHSKDGNITATQHACPFWAPDLPSNGNGYLESCMPCQLVIPLHLCGYIDVGILVHKNNTAKVIPGSDTFVMYYSIPQLPDGNIDCIGRADGIFHEPSVDHLKRCPAYHWNTGE